MRKKIFLKLSICSLVIFILSASNLFSYIYLNWTDIVFYNDGEKVVISPDIVSGAGLFLESHASILLFSNRIELSEKDGIDFTQLNSIIDLVIEKMKKFNEIYSNLYTRTADMSYNDLIITKLNQFDYESFSLERKLNPIVFEKVKKYLQSGDIRGLYYNVKMDSLQLIELLVKIKNILDEKKVPTIPEIWSVNQYFSEMYLFGQYASEVCKAISGS